MTNLIFAQVIKSTAMAAAEHKSAFTLTKDTGHIWVSFVSIQEKIDNIEMTLLRINSGPSGGSGSMAA